MLTYDDELALSDRLVTRRHVRDKLLAEERAATEEEAALLSDGDTAATDLVRAYLPYISKLASTICDRNIENKSSVGWDRSDLFNEGVIAALKVTNSFNARGRNNHPGVRFANLLIPSDQQAMTG